MHVVIRLFAGYREARRQLARARPAGERHGLGRRREVRRRHPATSTGRGLAIARNGEYVDPTVPLAGGDALALIPRSPTAPLGRRRVTMTGCPLSVDDALSCVRDDRCDGIVVFLGTVRSESRGKRVTDLDYEAYAEMAKTDTSRGYRRRPCYQAGSTEWTAVAQHVRAPNTCFAANDNRNRRMSHGE